MSGPETRYKYATDIFNGSGAQGWINGGKISSLIQHSTEGGQKKGKITIDGGNIDSAYLDYPLGDALSTLIYNNGTLGKLMMETSNNGGTFNPRPSNILDNPSFGEYHSGDVVLLLETGRVTGYGNIQDAHDAADDSKNVLMLLMDSVLPEPLRVTKTITLKGGFTITPAINDAFLNDGAMILSNQGAISTVTGCIGVCTLYMQISYWKVALLPTDALNPTVFMNATGQGFRCIIRPSKCSEDVLKEIITT